jgi:phosphate transport system ATP-binding protein
MPDPENEVSAGTVTDPEQIPDTQEQRAAGDPGVPGQVPSVAAGSPHAPVPKVAHHEVVDHGIERPVFETEDLSVHYSGKPAVLDVTMKVPEKEITAFIGPSGCGKSTILRCFNRMNDLIPGATVGGRNAYHGVDLYGEDVDAVQVRKRIGMVFQKPNPFPKAIYDNIAFGPKVLGIDGDMDELVESALRRASLWDDVKDRLKDNAFGMSGGQQQRLCIARALATNPDVLLMDEPCSALDPISTGRIEDLMHELKETVSIVIVTHNLQQAARVSDRTAFFIVDLSAGEDQRIGRLVEYGPTDRIFTNPGDTRTEEYVSGKFG